jgi:hypothetical protein
MKELIYMTKCQLCYDSGMGWMHHGRARSTFSWEPLFCLPEESLSPCDQLLGFHRWVLSSCALWRLSEKWKFSEQKENFLLHKKLLLLTFLLLLHISPIVFPVEPRPDLRMPTNTVFSPLRCLVSWDGGKECTGLWGQGSNFRVNQQYPWARQEETNYTAEWKELVWKALYRMTVLHSGKGKT